MNYEDGQRKLAPTIQQKILAYLGALKQGDSAAQMRLAADLDIPHNTLAMHVRTLEQLKYVATIKTGSEKLVHIHPLLAPNVAMQIIPDWDDRYGAHPYEGRTVRRHALTNSTPDAE